MDSAEVLAALKANPRVQEFMSLFEEISAKVFLENYAQDKSIALQYRSAYEESESDNEDQFRMPAEEQYWIIGQKKLFNLQCLWRAGQLDLPLIKISDDFDYWSENIRACPFLDTISPEEIAVMAAYLKQAPYDYDEEQLEINWQEYDRFKGEDGIVDYPDWYAYYDLHLGSSELLELPDLRGPVEERYRKAWREESLKENPPGRKEPDPRPRIWYEEWEDVSRFLLATETTDTYTLVENYYKENRFHEFEDTIRDALHILYNEPGIPYMEGGEFPDAIFQAAHVIKAGKMEQLMYEVHENHLSRKAMGIGYDAEPFESSIAQIYREQIRKGRLLLGEPGDLELW